MMNKLFRNFLILIALSGGVTASEVTTNILRDAITNPPTSRLMLAKASASEPVSLDMSGKGKQEPVSLKKAMVLSMVLPGAGQYYAGAKFRGQLFMGIEAATWIGFTAYRIYGNWKKNDYQSYAAAHAGVDNTGKNEEFYDWIGFYDNRNEFNNFGRLFYPERGYLPDTRAYYWQWDSSANRFRFKNMKDAAKTAFRNSTFLLGVAIANRIIASIDTYRTVKAARKKLAGLSKFGEYNLSVTPRPFGHNPSLSLAINRRF